MDLIDVGPLEMEEIATLATAYKKAQTQRIKSLREEIDCKNKIKELVEKAGLKRLPDGTIKFRCDGMLITLTPRDELVRVTDVKE